MGVSYREWLRLRSSSEKRDVSKDSSDYDIKQYHKENPDSSMQSGHLPDTFKKPNHPTFSQESTYSNPLNHGGSWEGDNFTPSEHNLKNMPAPHMQDYFNKVESPEALNLPNSSKLSKERYYSKIRERK